MEANTHYKINYNPFRSVTFTLVAIGLFFLPFNSYDGIPFLGEFARESCFIFFVLAWFFQVAEMLYSKKLRIPYKHPVFLLLIALLIWFFLSYIFNFFTIQNYYIKQTSGNERFMRQYGALIISALLLLLTYYNTFSKFPVTKVFKIVRKVFLYSFIFVSIYTFIETAIIYLNLRFLEPVLRLYDYFPFVDTWIDYRNGRVSSVTFEPPAFATYLITIAGWMFSFIITHKGVKAFIPGALVVAFTFLSGSRAGLVIILFQLLVFLFYFFKRRNYHASLIKFGLFIFLISIPILMIKGKDFSNYVLERLTSFELDDSKHSYSNKSRFGIMYTSGLVFTKNPLAGVGFGQQAFASRELYPSWATEGNWEFDQKYLNDDIKSFPPGYNIYTRLLAETGIIGFLSFMIFMLSIGYISYQYIRPRSKISWQSLILLVSFTGFALNWLKQDTFKIFGFWICLALLMQLTHNKAKIKKEKR